MCIDSFDAIHNIHVNHFSIPANNILITVITITFWIQQLEDLNLTTATVMLNVKKFIELLFIKNISCSWNNVYYSSEATRILMWQSEWKPNWIWTNCTDNMVIILWYLYLF